MKGINTQSLERIEKFVLRQKKNFTINFISRYYKIHPYIVKIAFGYLERMKVIEKVKSSTNGQSYRRVEK
ncbi:MAG: hypothetical protein OEL87_01485 [Nanoarchaeota archaeon]|nr:hypothetical protein [Nanoarchaeota archaeon]